MSTRTRWALLVLVIAIAVAAFVIAKPGGESKHKTKAQTTKRAAPAKPGTAPAPAPVFTEIRVKNGKPVGGVKKITVHKGERMRFVVASDVADEVHVHGYDFMKEVDAGGTVRFDFPAKIDGGFVVELENRGEQIADLRVQP